MLYKVIFLIMNQLQIAKSTSNFIDLIIMLERDNNS